MQVLIFSLKQPDWNQRGFFVKEPSSNFQDSPVSQKKVSEVRNAPLEILSKKSGWFTLS